MLNYFSRFSNEGRKFGLLLTGITQNAVAMLNNEAAQNNVLYDLFSTNPNETKELKIGSKKKDGKVI